MGQKLTKLSKLTIVDEGHSKRLHFKPISLRRCAAELGTSHHYLRKLFRKTAFVPAFRLNQVAYYRRRDFEGWRSKYWQAGRFIALRLNK